MPFIKSRPKQQLTPGTKEFQHAKSLARRLTNLGMSGKEIKEKVGIPGSTVSCWKVGTASPGIGAYAKLKKFFGEETPV